MQVSFSPMIKKKKSLVFWSSEGLILKGQVLIGSEEEVGRGLEEKKDGTRGQAWDKGA